AGQVGGRHEMRPGGEGNAARNRDARLSERLEGEELVPRGNEAVARQRGPDAHQLELAQQHLAEVRHRAADPRNEDVVRTQRLAVYHRVVRVGDDESYLVGLHEFGLVSMLA